MATPSGKLAGSLEILRALQNANGAAAIRARDMTRTHRERLLKNGIASARWLPLACDPEIHKKHEVDKTLDICFVGNVLGGPRAELIELLQKQFPNCFVGQRYFEEMARTYSAARIVFNSRGFAQTMKFALLPALRAWLIVVA